MSSQALPSIEDQLLDLSIDERIRIAKWIWNDLIQSPDSLPISDAVKAELLARLEDADLNPEDEEPWEIVREDLLRFLKDS
ncbi:MAG: addiction module protein [Candidatus Hydrogenedentes bacterium]|nr:addiction module protein [Candidatus Hydrogenedentota bacterium]